MATRRKSYPTISPTAWWNLRAQFLRSLPTQVTASYLATVLSMQEQSAKANVLPGLKAVGIIDTDGAPTPRATQWRDDSGYSEVCRQVLTEVYPQELLDAVPDPPTDPGAAEGWFMRTTGCGQNAAKKMASLYSVLTSADPLGGSKRKANKRQKTTGSRPKAQDKTPKAPLKPRSTGQPKDPTQRVGRLGMPEIRLNLEIRIDASVTSDQIDQIFASMAKHLYRHIDERG